MIVRLIAVLLVALALPLAAGCGGGDDDRSPPSGPPQPREPLAEVLPRYEQAAARQDCVAFARFAHSSVRPAGRGTDDPPDAAECQNLARSYVHVEGFRSERHQQFGSTGAVVEGTIAQQRVALVWTLDVDRRWKQVQATPPGAREQVRQPKRPSQFVQHAREWVDAQRRGDCRRVHRLFNVASPFVSGEQADARRFCSRYAEGRRNRQTLPAQLERSPAARPVDLGGTPDFHFFGVETRGGGYWTIVMATLPPSLPPAGHVEDSVLDYYPNRRPAP